MPISQVPFAGISNPVDFRNIVINGDMQVAQRSTSVASITATGYYTLDRFRTTISSLGTWTQSQSTDVPTGQGFSSSLKMDCTTADASPAAGDYLLLQQLFEGQNLQYLRKGTANAVSLTASFWVKSTKTGTFICELEDVDNSRSISKSYTVNTTNTWEFKTVTFAGDTTGAFTNDNGASLYLNLWLGAGTTYTSGALATSWVSTTSANRAVGQVNIADSDANDFLITGVQLEAGEQASGFEFMPIDVNLARCQRYYYLHASGNDKHICMGTFYVSTLLTVGLQFPTEMRAAPSLIQTSGTNYYVAYHNNTQDTFNDFSSGIQRASTTGCGMDNNANVSGTGGNAATVGTFNASAYIAFSAEL